ncbi:uncharacterized protein LOC129803900 isoform X1 [Phlebotomus papatasi]|nr:uncharacterized protein LOC129803900 isoform X1 [Phlebotomus papatasi]
MTQDFILFPKIGECSYVSCYCEENVWKLCEQVKKNNPGELPKCYSVFVSNAGRTVPLWRQKAGRGDDKVVIWDYHVFFMHCVGPNRCLVYDLDTTLPFPTYFHKYVTETFRSDLALRPEHHRNCLRRIARHDDQEFSNQSIINVMEKFVKTVNAMDETILVPSRLMDRQVGDSTDTVPVSPKNFHHGHSKSKKRDTVREYLNSADLLKLYNMLNLVKNDLLWARNDTTEEAVKQEKSTGELSTNLVKEEQASKSGETKEEVATVKGHVRRPSTISMSSSNSVSTLSDSESEISNENDSGIESERRRDLDKSQELAKQFRTHLLGLYRSLEQMTEAANYLTARYQSDVGPV